MITQNCLTCSKEFLAKKSHVARGLSKYCSRACFGISTRGREVSLQWREKLGRVHRGKPKSPEANKKNSDSHKGEKSFLWRGGVSQVNRTLRQNIMATTEYRQWRTSVFERDDYTCQGCGKRGNKLQADHIEAFSVIMRKHGIDSVQIALVCQELWNTENGRTLCVECHKKTSNFGIKAVMNY